MKATFASPMDSSPAMTRTLESVWLTLKGMGVAAALPVVGVAFTFGMYTVLIVSGMSEDFARSLFWQMGLFPISFLGCWWVFLFARTQLDSGGELIFVFDKHPLVRFGLLYSTVHAFTVMAVAGLASIAIPHQTNILIVGALEFALRGFFFSSLLLVTLSLTKSSVTGFLVSFAYATLTYFAMAGALPRSASLLPAQLTGRPVDVFSLYGLVIAYAAAGLAVTYGFERRYFG